MTTLPPNASLPPDQGGPNGEPVYSEAEWQNLVDYLSGEGSPEARSATERRLAEDTSFAAFAEPLILAWRAPISQPSWDWDANWAVIQRKAATLHSSSPQSPNASSRRRGVASWARTFLHNPLRWRPTHWATLACAAVAVVVLHSIVYVTRFPHYHYQGGTTGATVQLPDSSLVTLSPGSYLGTEYGFPNVNRTVYLFGEAHFTVIHSSRIPFIVQVPGASARVLGTSFLMQVDTTPKVQVNVTQGRVAIEICDTLGRWHPVSILNAGEAVHVPMLAVWITQAGYTLGQTGMPIREAARIEEALRRAAIRLGAAAAERYPR